MKIREIIGTDAYGTTVKSVMDGLEKLHFKAKAMEMVLPRNYVEIEQEEMMYLDGGAVYKISGTATKLKNLSAGLMASWYSLAGGYSYTATAAATTGVGLPLTFAAGAGGAYCYFVANEYR